MGIKFIEGDCIEVMKDFSDSSVDLIVTSPPYADQRKGTYGGIAPEKYVDWFSPIATELLRVIKPTGSFVLNIKEKAVDGERHTYVLELILRMREIGWLWTEEYIWHKKTPSQASGRIGLETLGSVACISLNQKNSP